MYDTKTHSDFAVYFDSTQKRNYWLLGYFGGGSINISEAYELAQQFSKETNLPLDTVKIDEILSSRRYKHFKYIYSSRQNQEPQEGAVVMENVYDYLTQ